MTAPQLLTLHDLLELLHTEGEHTSINHLPPGGTFTTRTLPSADAHTYATGLQGDVWYGLNPIHPNTTARGTTADVTRLAGLPADLDIKPGALPDFDTARAVINDLAVMLETRPTTIVNSGHGLQPIWALDPDDPNLHLDTPAKRTHAQALLRRWGRLVATVARAHGGNIDNIFDLPRILRAPGTTNHKHQPLPVLAIADTGHPLAAAQVDEQLIAYGVPELPEDTEQLGTTISPPADWAWADHTCIYAQKMIAGWATDTPTARHPWLISQATRLAALHRLGCITQHDHTNAQKALADRFRHLLTTGEARPEHRDEITEAHTWGTLRVAAMTEERARREVGNHPHQFEDLIPPTQAENMPGNMPPGPPPARHLQAVDGTAALAPQPHPTNRDQDGDNQEPPPPATSTVVEFERRPAPNEDNTALLLIDRHQHEIRYNPQRGRWLTWNGHKWATDDIGHIHELIRHIGRQLPEGEGWATYKKRALSHAGVRAIAGLATTDPRTVAPHEALDADPYALNTPHGPVDLRTGQLHPPNPDDLHTRAATVAPDPNHPTPRWEQFLDDTFAGHEDVLPFVQELAGYSATGIVTHHVLPFLHGPGGNGKSVFLDVLRAILGDYAGAAPAKFLMAGQQQHETEIARLSGLRMVITSEVNQDDKFDEAKVKILTGGDELTARFMRQDHFDFEPTHHLWLMGNHQPKVTGGGESFWRRLRLIPFTNVVPDKNKVEGLAKILVAEEGPGILAWIIQGAVKVIHEGMHAPASVLAATETYASEEDALARFIEDRCNVTGNPAARIDTADLRTAYTRWCDREGEKALSPQVFGRELRTRYGVQQAKSNGRRIYVGLELYADENEPEPELEWWQE